ncbi:MAG: choice-of-anchor L domain-containing protein, partial [Flavobacteriales bacterium]
MSNNLLNSLLSFLLLFSSVTYSQITTDNNPPFDTPMFLVDSILLGDGVTAVNHGYQGDANQIGYFDGVNSNIGIDSGIIMATGDISEIVPGNFGGGIINAINDPDLLDLANSVPGQIGQNFTVTSVNDVAILEFDFIPVSSYLSFKYVFASQEYYGFENTQYNDVFGFFISGPGIVGPYDSPAAFPDGAINIATFSSTEPNSLGIDLPITISSVNATYNSSFFIPNQDNGNNTVNPSNADGFTTVFTAEANVVCGELYHIKLAIADGTDTGLSSFVLLEGGSFSSPPLEITNSLNIDSVNIFTDCGAPVTLSPNLSDGDYTFLWNTGQTSESIIASPGYYWVEATDEFGCTTQSDSVRVYSQPLPEIILPDTIYFCENTSFTIDPDINSGTAPFEYDWGNNNTDSTLTISQQQTINLTVLDSNGCSDSHQVVLIEQPIPSLSFSPQELLVCGGIPVEVTIEGAESYQWSPNLYLSSDTASTVQITAESSIVYSVTGTDSIGCVNTILVPTTATSDFDVTIGIDPVSCQGFTDGSITLLAQSTAVSPILYSIDGGTNYSSNFIFEDLDYGTYEVKVKDGLGCVITNTAVIGSAAPEIEVIVDAVDLLCHESTNGEVFVSSITGGNISSGYSYNWFNSNNNQVISTDSSAIVPAGGYYLVVEDDNGCIATDEVSVEQPNPLSYQILKNDIICYGENNGYIQVQVNGGGTSPYNYSWTTNGNNPNPFLTNLISGTYELNINDANNCLTQLSVDVSQSNSPLSTQISNSSISCFGDATATAEVNVSGGTPPYSYLWSSGHVTSTASQLPSGLHTVTVSDSRGCSTIDSVLINESPEIILNTSSTPTSCYGALDGTATVTANGGQGNLTFLWSNGVNTSSITSDFGEYWVKVEDDLGCYLIDTILINQPQKIRVSLDVTDVNCFGGSDGVITSDVTGGLPFNNQTYTYQWSINGNLFGFNNYFANNLPFSTSPYQLEVQDANGCTETVYAFVNQPAPLKLDTSTLVSAYCTNIATGQASVVVEGGFLNPDNNYSFLWNTGETTPLIQNKTA